MQWTLCWRNKNQQAEESLEGVGGKVMQRLNSQVKETVPEQGNQGDRSYGKD